MGLEENGGKEGAAVLGQGLVGAGSAALGMLLPEQAVLPLGKAGDCS